MDVYEWIEKSRQMIIKGAETLPEFKSPEDELQELHLELTYACNLKCRMCNIWSVYSKDRLMPRKEMSVEELVDYLEESKILKGINGVVISGGEPFLKKGFQELCLYFLNYYQNISIGILSNLYSHSLIIRKLKPLEPYLDRFWIGTSLDGLGELHNNTRGVKDAFIRFRETLDILKKNFPGLPVVVNYTLTTDNYQGIYETHRFCRDHYLDLSIQFPVPWEGAEIFTFTEEQINKIESLLVKIMEDAVEDFRTSRIDEKGLMTKLFYLSGLIDYQRNPRRVFRRCVAGRRFTTISPEGKVYFCPILKNFVIGDLRDRPFDEIWKGKEARALRRKIDKGFCHCWLNCTIYPNANESLNQRESGKRKENPLKKFLDKFESLVSGRNLL